MYCISTGSDSDILRTVYCQLQEVGKELGIRIVVNIRTQNNHTWKWIVSLYPYMAISCRQKPPTIRA